MLFYAYTLLSLQLKSELTTKLAKILEDKGVLSDFISNFAVENRAEELAYTSEKVLFELSSVINSSKISS